MIFYYILSPDRGRFCGYHRRMVDWWLKRPEFLWNTFPQHLDKVFMFKTFSAAKGYIETHPDLPADCRVEECDLDKFASPI